MALSSGSIIRPFRHVEVRHYPEDASQTFKRGEVLIQGGSGLENKVKVASNNPTGAIVGIAAEDASGTTGNKVAVYLAKPYAEFVSHCDETAACDFTTIGSACALEDQSSYEVWTVETDDAGNDAAIVIEFLDPTTKTRLTTEGVTSFLTVFRFKVAATIWGSET